MIAEAERLFPDTVDKIYSIVEGLGKKNPSMEAIRVYDLLLVAVAMKNIVDDKTFLVITEANTRESVAIAGEPEIKKDDVARALMYLLLKLRVNKEIEKVLRELKEKEAGARA